MAAGMSTVACSCTAARHHLSFLRFRYKVFVVATVSTLQVLLQLYVWFQNQSIGAAFFSALAA